MEQSIWFSEELTFPKWTIQVTGWVANGSLAGALTYTVATSG